MDDNIKPHCCYFVQRKKRLCRMTVRPGKSYCCEHEPRPSKPESERDIRMPCPLDPKHTCYKDRLQHHLEICNARAMPLPAHISPNVNVASMQVAPRIPLNDVPIAVLERIICKINLLYQRFMSEEGIMSGHTVSNIHTAVEEEYIQGDRGQRSLRHLRQVSALLQLAEREKMAAAPDTCYMELGAGKGQLSYYMSRAWSRPVLLVDRAALRHKRDNKLRRDAAAATRIRADLKDLALEHVELVQQNQHFVAMAKHLCGVATDLALRCVTRTTVRARCRGMLLATCCHHRCQPENYVATQVLQDLGVSREELDAILGVVSWATCGDGRGRQQRLADQKTLELEKEGQPKVLDSEIKNSLNNTHSNQQEKIKGGSTIEESIHRDDIDNLRQLVDGPLIKDEIHQSPNLDSKFDRHEYLITDDNANAESDDSIHPRAKGGGLTRLQREEVGRRAKLVIDWGRVLFLREAGFRAHLVYFVPQADTLENICIVANQ